MLVGDSGGASPQRDRTEDRREPQAVEQIAVQPELVERECNTHAIPPCRRAQESPNAFGQNLAEQFDQRSVGTAGKRLSFAALRPSASARRALAGGPTMRAALA